MDRVEVLVIMAVCLSILNTAKYVEGQNTILTWRVMNEGNIKSFYFSPDNVQDFLDCVCDGNTLWCELFYTDSRGTYITGRGNITQSDTGNNMYSNMYSCRRASSNAPYVICERQTTTACSSVNICWSYQFSDFQGSCQLGDVGFTWVSDQTFTQSVHNKVTLTSPCNRSCFTQTTTGPTTTTSSPTTRSSTTTTLAPTTTSRPTSTTTVTTTTTPATVKPATTTATSSSTPTSTVRGEVNAPQKEDDSDDTGIIIGVVVAVLVVIAALMVGGIFCWRRRKNSTKADRARGTATGVQTSAFGISDRDTSGENIISLTPYENVLGTGRPSSDNVGSDNKNNDDYINSSTPSYENVLGNGRQSSGNVDSDNNKVLNQGPVQPSSGNENNDNNNGANTYSFTPYENVLGDGRQSSENVDSYNKNNGENTNSFTPYENALD